MSIGVGVQYVPQSYEDAMHHMHTVYERSTSGVSKSQEYAELHSSMHSTAVLHHADGPTSGSRLSVLNSSYIIHHVLGNRFARRVMHTMDT
jgi:hypothetical protein